MNGFIIFYSLWSSKSFFPDFHELLEIFGSRRILDGCDMAGEHQIVGGMVRMHIADGTVSGIDHSAPPMPAVGLEQRLTLVGSFQITVREGRNHFGIGRGEIRYLPGIVIPPRSAPVQSESSGIGAVISDVTG